MHHGKAHAPRFGGVAASRLHHDQLVAQVERARGFVEKQDLGTRHKSLRHEDELLLSAREPADGLLSEVRDFHAVKRPVHFFEALGRDAPGEVVHKPQKHHLEDRQTTRHGRELRDVTHALAGELAPVLGDAHGPLVPNESGDGFEKRRLPAAVLADHARNRSAGNHGVEVRENAVGAKRNGEVLELKFDHRTPPVSRRSSTKRKGTPTSDVTIPTGSTAPAERSFAATELAVMRRPPAKIVPGMRKR